VKVHRNHAFIDTGIVVITSGLEGLLVVRIE